MRALTTTLLSILAVPIVCETVWGIAPPSFHRGFHAFAEAAVGLIALLIAYGAAPRQAPLIQRRVRQFLRRRKAQVDKSAIADALEQVSDAIVITDCKGTIQYANLAFTALTGYGAEEIMGQNARILQSGRQDKSFYRELWHTILAGNVWRGELVNRRKDGTLYMEEMTITPVRASDRAISAFIAIKKEGTLREEAGEAQALLASIVESSEDAILSNTLDGRIASCNRGAEALYGYRAGELLGRPLSMLVCAEQQERLRRNWESLSRGESVPAFDGLAVRKDGKRVEISVRPFVVKNQAGRLLGAAAIMRDISERKEAERTRSLLASIVESSSDAIFSSTLDGRFLTWNRGAEAAWGYRAEEAIGRPVSILIRPGHHREQAEVLDRIRRGESSQFESVTVKADGSWLEVALTVSPIWDAAGAVVGSSTIARDISARKRGEEALRKSAEEYRSLVANIPDVIWTADEMGEPVFASSRCEQVSGYTAEEICRPGAWRALLHPDDVAGFEAAVRRMRAAYAGESSEEHAYDAEYRVRRKDGRWIWVHSRATGTYKKDGRRYVDGLLADITERKLLEQEMAYQARHDRLTGLPNRQHFEEFFQQSLAAASAGNGKLALLYLDMDGFKLINDSLGHHAGDDLLRQAAQRLSGCLRESEMLARAGGDEFTLVLPNADDPRRARGIAERMLGTLRTPFHDGSKEIFLTASVGIAFYPQDGADLLGLQRSADAAMLAAKRCGKNRVQTFTAAMGAAASRRLAVETELHHALERREFSLQFQPKIDLSTGGLVGLEALLRWNNTKLGVVGPSEFIPIAEENGLILPISDWVLLEVCRQQRAWRDAGCQPLQVGVNVSAVQFSLGDLPGTVARALAESGVDASFLDLEVTESAVMDDVKESARQLADLKHLGVSISLDDFGTGYSSLSYLVGFTIDYLKIDQSFVQRMDGGPSAIALVHAIVSLAHSLGIKTIAEGVESEGNLRLLKAMGCDVAQGFLLGRPMHPALIPDMQQNIVDPAGLAGRPMLPSVDSARVC